jgi:hypothetical protein
MVGIRLRELRREDWRAPARETDHGLPGLAVKNETDASSLVEVCFLIATFVQRMRPRCGVQFF